MFSHSISAILLALLATGACEPGQDWKHLDTERALRSLITTDAIFQHAQELQSIASSTPRGNRVLGSKGHNDTVSYITSQLSDPTLNGYYNVTLQPLKALFQTSANGSLVVNGINQTSLSIATYSKSGRFNAPLTHVPNLGCTKSDFDPKVAGTIAIVSRGNCTFMEKVTGSTQAGALAVIIYNDRPENLSFGITSNELIRNATIPAAALNQTQGVALAQSLQNGTQIFADLTIHTEVEERTTYNVLAETVDGDEDNVVMLGAHSDSVEAGPGINDDGSGTSSLIEVAKQLARFRVRNMVRFAWWSGEEGGMLGSTYYVAQLSAAAKKPIKLYLNFDMMASPNYVYGIFDGDNEFNVTSPPGSGDLTALFEGYFASQDLPWVRVPFNGRSDYAPFTKIGIAAGGLKTGAEQNKTLAEAAEFGGTAGEPYDKNYHTKGDNITNLNLEAFLVNTKAIAHAVAVYGRSFDSVKLNGTEIDDDADDDDADDDELEKRHVRKAPYFRKRWRIRKAP